MCDRFEAVAKRKTAALLLDEADEVSFWVRHLCDGRPARHVEGLHDGAAAHLLGPAQCLVRIDNLHEYAYARRFCRPNMAADASFRPADAVLDGHNAHRVRGVNIPAEKLSIELGEALGVFASDFEMHYGAGNRMLLSPGRC